MSEYPDHEQIGAAAKPGHGTAFLLALALAATLAVCGWNMRWSSSGPTSVTIIGINGPGGGASDLAAEMERPGPLPVAELADNR